MRTKIQAFFRNAYNFFKPMDTNIKNGTLEIYKRIRNTSITCFLLIIQAILLNISFLEDLFPDEDFADYILGLFLSGTLFSAIYLLFFFIFQRFWIWKNAQTCYISGIWYHVFARECDLNGNHLRVGWINISQNFYDLNVEAYNYDVSLENGELYYDEFKCSHWNFAISDLDEQGKIIACFIKNNQNSNLLSNSGVMELFPIRNSADNKLNELYAFFADTAPSSVKGNIKLFRSEKSKHNTKVDFLANAPEAWVEHVKKELLQKTISKNATIQQ